MFLTCFWHIWMAFHGISTYLYFLDFYVHAICLHESLKKGLHVFLAMPRAPRKRCLKRRLGKLTLRRRTCHSFGMAFRNILKLAVLFRPAQAAALNVISIIDSIGVNGSWRFWNCNMCLDETQGHEGFSWCGRAKKGTSSRFGGKS